MRRNYSEVNQLFFFKSINFCNILIENMLFRIIFVLIILLGSCKNEKGKSDFLVWENYLGDKGRTHYSELNQINLTNISNLEIAWIYNSGNIDEKNTSQIQCSPIVVDNILYGTSPSLSLFALDAKTGREIWKFDPENSKSNGLGVNRGVIFWDDNENGRIIYSSGIYLYAIDAKTGQIEKKFGDNGRIDLRKNLGRNYEDQFVLSNTPGVVYQNLLIQGTRVNEGPGSSPGHIRAYDLNTGKLEWIFHTIPKPGEYGYETWPKDAWKYAGGANSWAGMALDEKMGTVYIPTGSASFDFYGGDRKGKNLFANSLIALNAKNGKRVWHFQFVHHDLWDRDLPAPPNLVTIKKGFKSIEAVAQVTKSGHVFIFDRKNGKPIFPIEEKLVPKSNLEGEESWPTQPHPTKVPAFARQEFKESMINDMFGDVKANIQDFVKETYHSQKTIREQWYSLNSEQFTPPSEKGNIMFPGFDGGAEWGGAAYDPKNGWLYVNSNEMPWMYRAKKNISTNSKKVGESIFQQYCMRCHNKSFEENNNIPKLINLKDKIGFYDLEKIIKEGKGSMTGFPKISQIEIRVLAAYLLDEDSIKLSSNELKKIDHKLSPYGLDSFGRFLDENGYPAVKPPWGTLNAIDLNKGEIIWQVPLGEFKELTEKGFPITGTENYGGPIVTKGDLLFIGATKDQKFRAFNKFSGEKVWEKNLPAGGYATPITYEVDGKQFIVIACGGGKMGTPSGDSYVAFSLKKNK